MDGQGRIWRRRVHVAGDHRGRPSVEKRIEPRRAESTRHERGYLKVQVCIRRKKLMVQAHRVVWMVVHQSDIAPWLEINHRDGNPMNNDPMNLETVTHRDNSLHAHRVLLRGASRPKRMGGAKLTETDVAAIRCACNVALVPHAVLARQYKVCANTIGMISRGETWAHVSG